MRRRLHSTGFSVCFFNCSGLERGFRGKQCFFLDTSSGDFKRVYDEKDLRADIGCLFSSLAAC